MIDLLDTTSDWVRNPSDHRAVEAGYRFNEARAVFTVWWIERYCSLYEGAWAGMPLRLHGAKQVDDDFPIDREEPWDDQAQANALARAEAYREFYREHGRDAVDWQYDVTMRLFGWEGFSEKWSPGKEKKIDERRKRLGEDCIEETPYIRRFRRGGVWVAKKNKKALALDTPIPTPTGWTTVGEIREADVVFNEAGQPCRVTHVHEVLLGQDCYEVRFSNGEAIRCDAGHEWLTRNLQHRVGVGIGGGAGSLENGDWGGNQWTGRKSQRSRVGVRDTESIRATLLRPDGVRNHSITVADPLDLPDATLPIDPYVLGTWLGDGDSDQGRLTCSTSDSRAFTESFNERGYGLREQKGNGKAGRYKIETEGVPFRTQLRRLGR